MEDLWGQVWYGIRVGYKEAVQGDNARLQQLAGS